MRTQIIKLLILPVLILIVTGCGGKKDTPTPQPPSPAKAGLIFPAQNAACTSGTIVSNTQSTIVFNWNSTANTDSYELDIKNLLTGATTSQTSATNQLSVTLLRNTPYSWFVISKSTTTTTTTQSDTWKFYNAGQGTLSYAPFPATITAPTFGQSINLGAGTVNLTWTGSSVDNNISGYDVYFGTTTTPPLLQGGITDMFLNGVQILTNTTYYWKVITKDTHGNASDSGIFQFKVN